MILYGESPTLRHGLAFALSCLLSFPLLSGCGGGTAMDAGPKGDIIIRDENNYISTSTLTIPTIQTSSAADAKLCWGSITKDILCHDVSPSNIDSLTFLTAISSSTATVQKKLANGTLDSKDLDGNPHTFTVDHGNSSNCANLSQFKTFDGTAMLMPSQDYKESSSRKYLVLFATGTKVGAGAKTMVFLEPTASSSNTDVTPQADSCNILTFNADLAGPKSISFPASGKWLTDWSSITKDSMGVKVNFQGIDSMRLGFYKGMTPSQLQQKPLDIEMLATVTYRAAIPKGTTSIDLASTKDQDGKSFSGFSQSDSGTWLFALDCSSCQVPAPVVVAILNPT